MLRKISLALICAMSGVAQNSAPPLSAPGTQDGKDLPSRFGPPGSIGPQHGYFHVDSTAGPRVYFEAAVEPPLSDPHELKLGWGVFRARSGNRDVWHRYVIDQVHNQYFGYDLTVNALAAGPLAAGSYRIIFSPLSIQPEQIQPSGLTPAPLPRYPEPQTIRMVDKVVVELLVSPDGKRKIVDYIEIAPSGPVDPPAATNTGAAKDYTLDDGPVRFDFGGYVAINGQKFQGPTFFSKSKDEGATLWFCFPGQQGRYVLSLAPHEGLTKIGAVRDNVILFDAGVQRVEVRMLNPIAGRGTWNLYGVYDQAHGAPEISVQMPPMPAGAVAVTGGTDRLENLLTR